jgi:uncharacterized protein
MANVETSLLFPQDLLRFLYWLFFRPFTLQKYLDRLNPPLGSAMGLFLHGWQSNPPRRSLTLLAAFYIWLAPWLLGFGLGTALVSLGVKVNWLNLAFYLLLGIVLSLTFSLSFCVAFLLPFSLAAAIVSSGGFTMVHGILFSFLLGLAYGLRLNPAAWGLAAGVIYGAVFALLVNPLSGLAIGAAFLIGYFRLFFYVAEAPLAWALAVFSARRHAEGLWGFNPVRWDELIWPPLPGLDRHLQALARQNQALAREAMTLVKASFRQGWAAKRVSVPE